MPVSITHANIIVDVVGVIFRIAVLLMRTLMSRNEVADSDVGVSSHACTSHTPRTIFPLNRHDNTFQSSSTSMEVSLANFAPEILVKIIDLLDIRDILRLESVSRLLLSSLFLC